MMHFKQIVKAYRTIKTYVVSCQPLAKGYTYKYQAGESVTMDYINRLSLTDDPITIDYRDVTNDMLQFYLSKNVKIVKMGRDNCVF
jgi:hypothetical protein